MRISYCAAALGAILGWCTITAAASLDELAFPGAVGWAATTPGGRGGRIIRVTTLAPTGPGSFLEALNAPGPRVIVFEIGGVIDLSGQKVVLQEPFVTIAGQTAPSPGVTLVRQQFLIQAHDVVIRHLRVRPGTAGHAKKSGWEADGISTSTGAYNVIVDHCSLSWATDENLSASGTPFKGSTPDEWRRNTSHWVTFSNNIIAEGLSHATHSKGEHSKGSLLMENVTGVLIWRNLYADCSQRHPLAKGGTRSAVVNNFIYNPGVQAVAYRLPFNNLWIGRHPETGRMELLGNFMQAGPDTRAGLPLLTLEGMGDLTLHAVGNVNLARDGSDAPFSGIDPKATSWTSREDGTRAVEQSRPSGRILVSDVPVYAPPHVPDVLPAVQVKAWVLAHAGARPWDRDAVDARIVRETAAGTGRIIDSETEVGGYPVQKPTYRRFDESEWDLQTMEPKVPYESLR